ncbi:MAG: alpha/beta hydrolase [Caldilineaceae bacterium]
MTELSSIPTILPLWPNGAPGSETWSQIETESLLPPDIRVIRNVTQPTLTAYLPDPAHANGTSVIVCPGGAFHILAIEHEGVAVARWLAARGVTAFVLKYRLLPTGDDFVTALADIFVDRRRTMQRLLPIRPFALADGLQAVRLVRHHAVDWQLDPHKIGLVGFSAGGRLTATVLQGYDRESRPDFAGFIYGGLWEEFPAPPDAPPLFIAAADDDAWSAPLCARLYQLWKEGGHPAELHIYAKGGHGFGMRQQGLPTDTWIDRFGEWLQLQGLISGTVGQGDSD